MTDVLAFFYTLVERDPPIKTTKQEWTMHTMVPDQFCICPVCLEEAHHVQSVLQIFPIITKDDFRTLSSPILIAAQHNPCGHWCTGFMYTRRVEPIRRNHPAWKEEYRK